MRPSWGTRRSAMSRSAMIFTRDTRPATRCARHGRGVDHDAVDAKAHAHVGAAGLEVDVGGAAAHRVGDHRVHQLDHRRLVGGLAQLDHLGGRLLGLLLDLLHRLLQLRQLADQRVDVRGRRRPRGGRRSRCPCGCRRARARWPGRRSPPAACAGRRRRSAPPGSGAALAASIRLAAPMSTSKTLRSTCSRPLRSASARASWSGVTMPSATSAWPSGRPVSRARARPCSIVPTVGEPEPHDHVAEARLGPGLGARAASGP